MGADGKVKIQVCQDFKKLNATTKKDYFPLSFMDIILNDYTSSQECYNFLEGFSGYNQVFNHVGTHKTQVISFSIKEVLKHLKGNLDFVPQGFQEVFNPDV